MISKNETYLSANDSDLDISVIITAHLRREFLIKAVESVLSQVASDFSYQIIVIKNFTDSYIDDFLEKNNIVSIVSERQNLGSKLAQGISIAKGKIISFLEDDDLFLQGKLRSVVENFKSSPDLVYFHNSALEFNEKKGSSHCVAMSLGVDAVFRGPLHYETIIGIIKKGGHGNNSCISLRRDKALSITSHLERLNVSCDGFILLWFSCFSGELKFSKDILTKYMVHESFTHRKESNIYEYIESNYEKAKVMYKDKKIGLDILQSENRSHDAVLVAKFLLLKELMNLNLFSPHRMIRISSVLSYLYQSIKMKKYNGILGSVVHLVSFASKRAAINMSYIFRIRE